MDSKPHDILTKISLAELRAWQRRFHEFTTPAKFSATVERLGEILGDHVVDSSRAQFWRDAFNAAAFSSRLGASSVRLLAPSKTSNGEIAPDFEIRVAGRSHRYEIVEALLPERNRGTEFRQDRVEGPITRPDRIPSTMSVADILSQTAARKKGKNYENAKGLVIVTNFWLPRTERNRRRAFLVGTRGIKDKFPQIWAMTPNLVLIWSDGVPMPRATDLREAYF